jgi:hypothetical protein
MASKRGGAKRASDEGEAEGAATAPLMQSYGLGLHEPTAHPYHRVVKQSPNLKMF